MLCCLPRSSTKPYSLLLLLPDWVIFTLSWHSPSDWSHCSSYISRFPREYLRQRNGKRQVVLGKLEWSFHFLLIYTYVRSLTVKPADLCLQVGTHQQLPPSEDLFISKALHEAPMLFRAAEDTVPCLKELHLSKGTDVQTVNLITRSSRTEN